MAESGWHYIGPDRTGLLCNNCCDGFSLQNDVCKPVSCPNPPSSFRPYICTNPAFPTPHHSYKFTDDSRSSVSIVVNTVVCRVNGQVSGTTECWDYTPPDGLNPGGRVGGIGCSTSPVYVEASSLCSSTSEDCPPCPGDPLCCGAVGEKTTLEVCSWASQTGCYCYAYPEVNTCSCKCNYQYEYPNRACYRDPGQGGGGGGGQPPDEPCQLEPWYCSGGITFYWCPNRDPQPECPPNCDYATNASICDQTSFYGFPCVYRATCVDVGGGSANYFCISSCDLSCYYAFPRFGCECGQCRCQTSDTCCVDSEAGWSFKGRNSTSKCKPCYDGWEGTEPEDCCDVAWKQKGCRTSYEVCCNDGRCYANSTAMCDMYPPPPSE